MYWYQKLYERLLGDPLTASKLRILEIGSGMSPLKHFYPSVTTSDIMPLGHIDYVFDAHEIDRVKEVASSSLDVIILTNVLHHLEDPITFLLKACGKLRLGGRVVLLEPYFSKLSWQIYNRLHHEPSDFNIEAPVIARISGPLSSANMAIPYMIFFGEKGWDNRLREFYEWDDGEIFFYTSLSYMATGGVARNIPIPAVFYKMMFKADNLMANRFPAQLASFFCLTLVSIKSQ